MLCSEHHITRVSPQDREKRLFYFVDLKASYPATSLTRYLTLHNFEAVYCIDNTQGLKRFSFLPALFRILVDHLWSIRFSRMPPWPKPLTPYLPPQRTIVEWFDPESRNVDIPIERKYRCARPRTCRYRVPGFSVKEKVPSRGTE